MTPESSDKTTKTESDLFKVIVWATAIGFGGLVAFLASFRSMRHDATLEFSYRTVIGFAIGAFIGWFMWWAIKRAAERDTHHSRTER